mgnify:CR=1 FL=1
MEHNIEKIDEAVLALLYLNTFKDKTGLRAWKGFDWDAMNRLCDKGFISNPKRKAKSVAMFEEGFEKAGTLFKKYFTLETSGV